MTQEKIDSIRERMCDDYCMIPSIDKLTQEIVDKICGTLCPLNELDAEPIKGRWIKENMVFTSDPPQYVWRCSECGYSEHGFSAHILTNHCPACGAKMEASE